MSAGGAWMARWVSGAFAALIVFNPLPCAAIDWLVFVVDRSKSIDERELTLQRNAYVRLLSDASVISALDGAHVAIVEFDTRSEIVVDWTDPETAARRYQHKGPDGLRGQTGIGGALTTALALLVGKSGRLVVDISGDGKENVDTALLSTMRAAADERSVEINGLAIMTPDTPEIDRYYSQQVVNGFVLPVEEAGDFQSALKRKLFYEIAGPDPRRRPRSRGGAPLIRGLMFASDRIFAPDFLAEPIWWAEAPRAAADQPLPARVEVDARGSGRAASGEAAPLLSEAARATGAELHGHAEVRRPSAPGMASRCIRRVGASGPIRC